MYTEALVKKKNLHSEFHENVPNYFPRFPRRFSSAGFFSHVELKFEIMLVIVLDHFSPPASDETSTANRTFCAVISGISKCTKNCS